MPISFIRLSIIGACTRYRSAESMTSSVTLRLPPPPPFDAVDVEDLDALDLLHRPHALAHDALDPFQQLAAEARQPRRFRERVLGFVQLHGALGVDLVARRRGERLDLLRFRLALGGDLGGVGEAGRRGLFGLRLAGQPQRVAFGFARRGDEIGDLAPLGDLASRAP